MMYQPPFGASTFTAICVLSAFALVSSCGPDNHSGDHWQIASPVNRNMTDPLLLETKHSPDTVYFSPLTMPGNTEAMGSNEGCEEFVVLGSSPVVHLFTDNGATSLPESYIQKRLLSAYICYIRAGMNTTNTSQVPIRLLVHVYTNCRAATPVHQAWYETDGRAVKRITS